MSRKLDDLIIGLQLRTKDLETGLKETKRQLQQHGRDVRATGNSYDELAIVAGAAFYKLVGAIKSGTNAYNQYNNSMIGLRSIVQGTGNDFSKAQQFIDRYTNDGLIPAANAATSLKNLLNRGYTDTQAEDVMSRLKDSASFGRQAALTLGEAVQSATEGLKNENSILVDNAGVTKNVSVMWKEYAATIGKGVDSLTIQEKIQAEYNGIMKETQHQVGDAAKYSNEFAGAQSRSAAETLKLKQAFGEALVPALGSVYSVLTPITTAFASFMKNNPALAASVTTIGVTFLGIVTALTAVGAAVKIVKPALEGLNASFLGLLKNPIVLTLTALAGVFALVTVNSQKAKKAQEEYNSAVEKHNKLVQEGIDKTQIAATQQELDQLKELSEQYTNSKEKYLEYKAVYSKAGSMPTFKDKDNLDNMLKYEDAMQKAETAMKALGATEDTVTQIIKEKEKAIANARIISVQEANDTAKSIAVKKQEAMETQALIDTYKKAKKDTSEWQNAQKQLADKYPQFASASGILIESIQAVANANGAETEQEWKNLQEKVKVRKADIETSISANKAILEQEKQGLQAMQNMGTVSDFIADKIRDAQARIDELTNKIASSQKELGAINAILNSTAGAFAGAAKPVDYSSSVSSYENAALDSALKIHDHRVKMSEMSKEAEVKDLEEIKSKYARTADEIMQMEEKIYDTKKELAERSLEDQENALKNRTDASVNWIEDQKLKNPKFSSEDEEAAYNRMIVYHKEYLDKIWADEKILQADKDRIRKEELATIRDYNNKVYQLQKDRIDKERSDTVDSINKIDSAIVSALRSKYQEQQENAENSLQKELDSLEDWKDKSIDIYNSAYDAKIKGIEDAAKAQETALRAEIDALDKAKQDKDRSETDASELSQISRLQDKIAYEHDEYNKVELQKQLNKLIADREKRLYEQQIEDRKDALEKQIDDIKNNAEHQKEILEQEKKAKIDYINELYNAQKVSLDQQMNDLRNFYAQKLSQASLEAEAEKLIMDNNQKEILELLKAYGNEYEITGKTLGDRLYDGFKPAIDNIKSLIASITASIDAARQQAIQVQIEASKIKIPTVQSSAGSGAAAAAKSVTVSQQLVFNTPVAPTPSEVSRKTLQASRELAMDWT